MNLSLFALLEHEDTRSTTIRFVCALRKTLSGAPATQQSLEWGLEVERLHRSFSKDDLTKAYADGKYTNRLTANQATTRPEPARKPPEIIPTKPTALLLTVDKAVDYLEAAVVALLKSHKDDPIEVEFSSWCDWVAKKHLSNGTKCWDDTDSQVMPSNKTQRWKNTVSQALQELKKDDVIALRKKPERWHVFRD